MQSSPTMRFTVDTVPERSSDRFFYIQFESLQPSTPMLWSFGVLELSLDIAKRGLLLFQRRAKTKVFYDG